jgi:Toluene-4-monooxygenase system protein B (TmoB)
MSGTYPVPVIAVFGSDVVAQLVLLMSDDTVARSAAKVAHHSVGRRVRPREASLVLYHQGRMADPSTTVSQAGIVPGSFVYVDYNETGTA